MSVVCIYASAWLAVVIYSQWLYIVLEHSRSLCSLNLSLNHLIVHTKWLVNMQMMSLYCGLLIVWSLIDRLDDVYRDIAGFMYLLDVLVVVVHISHSNCWSTYYCTTIEVSVLRAGRGRGGWGVEVFSNWNFFFLQKHRPGVLKRKKNFGRGGTFFSLLFFRGGGGRFWGVWGAPRPHPGVARGRKSIHFFLWPWHVTG